MHELSDEELMRHVVAGDEGALEVLYDRYAPLVMGLVYKITGNREEAEEILQEAFWRVWDNAEAFEEARGSFRGWLLRIARNQAVDTWRRRKIRPEAAADEPQPQQLLSSAASNRDVAEAAWDAVERRKVRSAMAALPPEQYRVIRLAYFQGLTRQEIARETGAPLGTVHTRARLALRKLRALLRELDVEERPG